MKLRKTLTIAQISVNIRVIIFQIIITNVTNTGKCFNNPQNLQSTRVSIFKRSLTNVRNVGKLLNIREFLLEKNHTDVIRVEKSLVNHHI